jgi:hypothetical protein
LLSGACGQSRHSERRVISQESAFALAFAIREQKADSYTMYSTQNDGSGGGIY